MKKERKNRGALILLRINQCIKYIEVLLVLTID